MRISIQKSTGQFLEMQTDATPGTLIKNAVNSGIDENDVLEKEISESEFQILISKRPLSPKERIKKIETESRPSDRFIREAILLLVQGLRSQGITVVETLPIKKLIAAEVQIEKIRAGG
jgi:hypothetical protein